MLRTDLAVSDAQEEVLEVVQLEELQDVFFHAAKTRSQPTQLLLDHLLAARNVFRSLLTLKPLPDLFPCMRRADEP